MHQEKVNSAVRESDLSCHTSYVSPHQGHVVVHYQVHVWYVQAACCHIGGNQDWVATLPREWQRQQMAGVRLHEGCECGEMTT